MSLPDRNNPYNFDEFRAWRDNQDYLKDDPVLLAAIRRYAPELGPDAWTELEEFSSRCSTRWARWADESGLPENAPRMLHYDAYNNRVDRIVRPASTHALEREIWGEAMFSEATDPWVRFIKVYLFAQIGEAGVGCAHCCTSGLVLILSELADTPDLEAILEELKEGKNGDYPIGAQFLSEIQGGSDVQANRVEAVETDEGWRIYGTKFYCSAAHADYMLVTAKPKGSRHVAAFLVPAWLPGNKRRERRNGMRINKLKSKLGTRELPTAEIAFDGALAYPVGDLERGLSNVVGIVLAHSRFITGLGAAAYLARAAREAKGYSKWRTAFGVTIERFGLVARQLREVDRAVQRNTASIFKLQREITELDALRSSDRPAQDEVAHKRREFRLRMLIMLHKLVVSEDSSRLIETAMSIFGGHGLMEDFSAVPRLYRDAVVLNGAWEGPRNLLLTRIFMDLQRAAARWYPATAFVDELLVGAEDTRRAALASSLEELLSFESLVADDPRTLEVCERWDAFCAELFHEFQDCALSELDELT